MYFRTFAWWYGKRSFPEGEEINVDILSRVYDPQTFWPDMLGPTFGLT